VTLPIVGGVTVWGTAPEDQWVSPGGSRDGDLILMTKGPSIEATGLLTMLYQDRLGEILRPDAMRRALKRVDDITVVKDALTAFAAGGVHAMHDATEGGVLGGLWEMHTASGVPLTADLDAIALPDDIAHVADTLGFDPWQAISEGTLLAAVDPTAADGIRKAWDEAGIESYRLGAFDAGLSESIVTKAGTSGSLLEPEKDPFWELFFAGL